MLLAGAALPLPLVGPKSAAEFRPHYSTRQSFLTSANNFPAFLPKEINSITDPFARKLASRIERVPVDPKYYSGDYGRMLETLLGCKSTGCVFLVAGRNIDGKFKVVDDLDIPAELRDLFIPIPPEKFRMDISSTQIRNALN